jgi:hypothetical protein
VATVASMYDRKYAAICILRFNTRDNRLTIGLFSSINKNNETNEKKLYRKSVYKNISIRREIKKKNSGNILNQINISFE